MFKINILNVMVPPWSALYHDCFCTSNFYLIAIWAMIAIWARNISLGCVGICFCSVYHHVYVISHPPETCRNCYLCTKIHVTHWIFFADDVVGLLLIVSGITIMVTTTSRSRPPMSSCRTTQMLIVVLLSPSWTTMSVSLRKTVAPAVRVGHRHREQQRGAIAVLQ